MNYQEMTDDDIDLAVSEIVFGKTLGRRTNYTFDKAGFVFTGSGHSFTPLDNENVVFTPKIKPTSSWADAGPIIQENGINLMASKVVDSAGLKEWEAMSYEGNCHHWGELNPLRAAMIVFLMMKGGE
ncbi:phage protein NinX family protein [Rosenbergiella nectarea]|uniref:phage protein NinX family protein n=1 Tax=Rosenbergiella nectarea TaxID=988801 RepID=UPI001F4D4F18|nr:phage protein NinX family protein [Rosenbergiella nectarea]